MFRFHSFFMLRHIFFFLSLNYLTLKTLSSPGSSLAQLWTTESCWRRTRDGEHYRSYRESLRTANVLSLAAASVCGWTVCLRWTSETGRERSAPFQLIGRGMALKIIDSCVIYCLQYCFFGPLCVTVNNIPCSEYRARPACGAAWLLGWQRRSAGYRGLREHPAAAN